MPFQKFGLPTPLVHNLRTLGYVNPTPVQTQAIPAIRSGRDLVATPGRLLAHLKGGCAMPALRTLILDEADQLFDLGFFPDVKRIVSHLPARRQTLLFSATMPPEVAKLGRVLLRDPLGVSVGVQ